MVQYARPNRDIVTGAWTPLPLYTQINEVSPNDATYISSQIPPSNDTFEVGLSNLSDPITAAGHILRYRIGKNIAGGRRIDMTVQLRQGATIIATYTHANITGPTFSQYNQTLTAAQANSIANYNDLRIRFIAKYVEDGTATFAKVSWTELQIPSLPMALNATITGNSTLTAIPHVRRLLIGNVLMNSVAEGRLDISKALNGSIASHSLLYSPIFVKRLVTGAIVGESDMSTEWQVLRTLDGNVPALLTARATAQVRHSLQGFITAQTTERNTLNINKGITSELTAHSMTVARIEIGRPLAGSSLADAMLDGNMSVINGASSEVVATSALISNMPTDYKFHGAVNSVSAVISSPDFMGNILVDSTVSGSLSVNKGVEGSLTSLSTVDASFVVSIPLNGTIMSETLTSSSGIHISRNINSSIPVESVVHGTVVSDHALEGNIVGGTMFRAEMNISRKLTGLLDINSTTTVQMPVQFLIAGVATALSFTDPRLVIKKGVTGDIVSILFAEANLTGNYPIAGEADSLAGTIVRLNITKNFQGLIHAGSVVNTYVTVEKPLIGSSDSQSVATAQLQGASFLNGTSDSFSTTLAQMAVNNYMNGELDAQSALFADISSVDGLRASISSQSKITGTMTAKSCSPKIVDCSCYHVKVPLSPSQYEQLCTIARPLEGQLFGDWKEFATDCRMIHVLPFNESFIVQLQSTIHFAGLGELPLTFRMAEKYVLAASDSSFMSNFTCRVKRITYSSLHLDEKDLSLILDLFITKELMLPQDADLQAVWKCGGEILAWNNSPNKQVIESE